MEHHVFYNHAIKRRRVPYHHGVIEQTDCQSVLGRGDGGHYRGGMVP
jgi:hypothetical protein